MTDLRGAWHRTEANLRRAYESAGCPALEDFHDFLAHNELELTADVLADFGDARGDLSEAFWQALMKAYQSMELGDKAVFCQLRRYEAAHGFIEARVTLVPTQQGGRTQPILTDYRPDWNIGNRTQSGGLEINGARVTIEDAPSIAPGGTGLVRLHPLLREAWAKVELGAEIAMHEGSRVVGAAIVLRKTLRG